MRVHAPPALLLRAGPHPHGAAHHEPRGEHQGEQAEAEEDDCRRQAQVIRDGLVEVDDCTQPDKQAGRNKEGKRGKKKSMTLRSCSHLSPRSAPVVKTTW